MVMSSMSENTLPPLNHYIDSDRAMVRAHDIGTYRGCLDVFFQIAAYKEIIDSPSYVALPGPGLKVPPTIILRILVEHAKCIQVTMLHKPIHPFALLRQEARDLGVLLGSCYVYLLMGRCEIAASNNLTALFLQIVRVLQEGVIELHLIAQSLGRRLAVGKVDIEEYELAVIRYEDSALVVKASDTKAALYALRLQTGKLCHPTVAAFVRTAVISLISFDVLELLGHMC